MSKYFFSITEWPGGLGLDFGNSDGSYSFAGASGGGTGREVKRFPLNTARAKQLLEELVLALKEEEKE